jgi:hypothetical protein
MALPGVRLKPTRSDIRGLVRSRLEGLEYRQALRAEQRRQRRLGAAVVATKQGGAEQLPLISPRMEWPADYFGVKPMERRAP